MRANTWDGKCILKNIVSLSFCVTSAFGLSCKLLLDRTDPPALRHIALIIGKEGFQGDVCLSRKGRLNN